MSRKVFLVLILMIIAIPSFSHTHYLDTAVTISNRIQDIDDKIDFLSQIIVCYYESGNKSKADSLITNLSRYNNNSYEFVKTLFKTKNYSKGLEALKTVEDYQYVMLYLDLLKISVENNDFEIAEKIKRKGRFKNETQDNSKSKAEILLAKRYIELGKITEAEVIIDSTSTPIPYSIGMRGELWVDIWIESAKLYSQLNKKNKAIKKCELAENTLNELFKKRYGKIERYSYYDINEEIIKPFYDIFDIYLKFNEKKKCYEVLSSIDQVIKNKNMMDEPSLQNQLLLDVIYSYSIINDYNKSEEIWNTLEFEDSKIRGLILIAKSYIERNDYKNGNRYLIKSLKKITKIKESNEIFWPRTSYRKYELLDEIININGLAKSKKTLKRIKKEINALNFDFHKCTSLLKFSLIYSDSDSDTFSFLLATANSSLNRIDDISMKIYKNLEFATILSKNNRIQLADNYIKEAIKLILGADRLNSKFLQPTKIINTCITVSPHLAIELVDTDISDSSKIEFLIKLHNQNKMNDLSEKEIIILKEISDPENNSISRKFPSFGD